MSLLRNKGSKKSGTILHAVPENTACVAAPLRDQRDTTTHAYQDASNRTQVLSGNHSTLSPPGSDNSKSSVRNSNASTGTAIKPCSMEELRSVLSNTSLKGAIGVYKHGRIQWREKDRSSPEKESKNGHSNEKGLRPKIQVVIPSGICDRPLPALPFFGNPSKSHMATASIEIEKAHDVSPPSAGTKRVMRNSIVSPLSQTPPVSFGQFQHSMSRVVRRTTVRSTRQRPKVSISSNSSNDSYESDSASTYSNHSSETSVEAESSPTLMKARKHAHHISILNPIAAGVFESSPESYTKQFNPLSTSPPRRYAHHPPIELDHAFQPTCTVQPTRNVPSGLTRRPTSNKSSKRSKGRRSIASTSGVINQAISRSTSRQLSNPLRGPSPTLSEAENDLEEQLTCFTKEAKPAKQGAVDEQNLTFWAEDSPFKWDELLERKHSTEDTGQPRKDSPTVISTSTTPPLLPRKSSKRRSVAQLDTIRLSRIPRNHIASQMNRGQYLRRSQALTLVIPGYKRMTEDIVLSPNAISPGQVKRNITPGNAEGVILNIFRSLDHFDDLFATAVLNRGFYRVFKRHELELIKSTLKKMSPPAWEFREIAFPGHDMLHDEDLEMTRPLEEYIPSTYLHSQKRDMQTIRSIKALIKEKCQSFVRPEISIALIGDDSAQSARIDDALWRIWTFCKVFGSGKGREDDIMAQQDWLKGGLLVHQQACTFSVMNTDYMNDTLVGAPECFAKGNEGGLTAEQLFDIMELWNCLGVLLQGFEGRTAQARECGIYDNTDIRGGDIDGEETMLDEWCYYLLTFGLSTVLELAAPCSQMNVTPFKIAVQNGWTNWKPPVFGGTRRNFLKEAASRVYEDKIARTYATTSTRDIQRQLSKQRFQKHITELRHRKASGLRMPMISMAQERPMSEWSTVIGNLTRPRPAPSAENDIVSHIPVIRSALAQDPSASIAELPAARTPPPPSTRSSSPRRTVAQPLLPTPPPSTVPSVRDRNSVAMSMPSIEEHPAYRKQTSVSAMPLLSNHPAFRTQHQDHFAPAPFLLQSHRRQESNQSTSSSNSLDHPAFQQHQIQRNIYNSHSHENTAEKAIYRIVEMGFTADQARDALRMTDLGDGLRIDRAVELLLRQSVKF